MHEKNRLLPLKEKGKHLQITELDFNIFQRDWLLVIESAFEDLERKICVSKESALSVDLTSETGCLRSEFDSCCRVKVTSVFRSRASFIDCLITHDAPGCLKLSYLK